MVHLIYSTTTPLPQGLHPDPATLLNDSPDPYMIGIHTAFYTSLHLLPPEVRDAAAVVG